jgi:hypothetical protein
LIAYHVFVTVGIPRRLSLSIARQCGVRLPSLNPSPPPSTFRLLAVDHSSFLGHIDFISDMSQPSSTSSLRDLFNAALQDYQNQTGTKLVEHPLARQFETCDSVDSITVILQEQAQIFREFRDNGKLMKSLKVSVDVLSTLSASTVLGEVIGLVHLKSLIAIPFSQLSFYSHSHLRKQYSLASPSYLPYVPSSDPICKSSDI